MPRGPSGYPVTIVNRYPWVDSGTGHPDLVTSVRTRLDWWVFPPATRPTRPGPVPTPGTTPHPTPQSNRTRYLPPTARKGRDEVKTCGPPVRLPGNKRTTRHNNPTVVPESGEPHTCSCRRECPTLSHHGDTLFLRGNSPVPYPRPHVPSGRTSPRPPTCAWGRTVGPGQGLSPEGSSVPTPTDDWCAPSSEF